MYDDPGSVIHESLPLINVWGPKAVHSLSVVTRDWKYIYWPYAEQGFTPAEELYHTADDPLERTNLIADESKVSDRNRMRSIYDSAVSHWQQAAVPYHNYRGFGELFERN